MEFLGLPIGVYIVGVGFAVVLMVIFRLNKNSANIVDKGLSVYDGSALDVYVTAQFQTLPPQFRESIRDLIEIMSPVTERTANDLDDKTLKILQDYVDANELKL